MQFYVILVESDGVYPSGLKISFFCEAHCPPESASPQHREFQAQLRSKYRIDETDLEYIPGKNRNRRRKKKLKRDKPVGIGRTGGHAMDLKKDLRDQYTDTICAICMYLTKPTGGIDSCFPESIILETKTCVTCNITVHSNCLSGIDRPCSSDAINSDPGQWKCIACSTLSWNDDPVTDPNCAFCPRRGGFFRPTYDGRWVHAFCAKFAPGVCTVTEDGDIHVKKIDKALKNKPCTICNRTRGLSVRCQYSGCQVLYHSLCAEKSRLAYQKIRNGIRTVFCSEHIPEDVRKLPENGWLDVHEVSYLRFTLEKAKMIADSARRRDKMKKLICSTEGELFITRFNRLLEKNRVLKSGVIALGQVLSGPGVVSGTTIVALGTGVGGLGTYKLLIPELVEVISAGEISRKNSDEGIQGSITEDDAMNTNLEIGKDSEVDVAETLDPQKSDEGLGIQGSITEDDAMNTNLEIGKDSEVDVAETLDPQKSDEGLGIQGSITEDDAINSKFEVGKDSVITKDSHDGTDEVTLGLHETTTLSESMEIDNQPSENEQGTAAGYTTAVSASDSFSNSNEESTLFPLLREEPTNSNDTVTLKSTGEAIELLFKGFINGNILTVVDILSQSIIGESDDILNSSIFRDTDLEEEFKTIIDSSTASAVKKKKSKVTASGTKSSGGIFQWESFEGRPVGEEVEISTKKGPITISSTWLSSSKKSIKVPEIRIVCFAGTEVMKSDFISLDEEDDYISMIQARLQKIFSETRPDVGIFRSDKDAEKFPKQLGNDVKSFLALSKADFKKEKSRVESELASYKESTSKAREDLKSKNESPKKKAVRYAEEDFESTTAVRSESVKHTLAEQVGVLFSSLTPFTSDPKMSFDSALSMSGLLVTEGEDEWAVPSSDEEKLCLERRIQDILNILETFEVPKSGRVILPDVNIFECKMTSGPSISKKKDKNFLSADFVEIPYELIPDYNKQVKRPLSLEILSSKLKRHEYSSMHLLSKDFYEMLTNGRRFTLVNSQVENVFHIVINFSSINIE